MSEGKFEVPDDPAVQIRKTTAEDLLQLLGVAGGNPQEQKAAVLTAMQEGRLLAGDLETLKSAGLV